MQLKKNWLYYGNLLFFFIMMAYVMFSGIGNFSNGEEFAYLYRGIMIVALFLTWLLTQGLIKLVLWIGEHTSLGPVKQERLREILTVCLILAAAVGLRYLAAVSMPYEVSDDFSNIFQSADCVMRGTLWTEGRVYSSFLSVFPQYFLYTLVLAGVFSVFGSSLFVAAMVQLFFSGCSLLVLYGIAKALGGKRVGFGAMLFTALSPVMILGQRQLSVLSFHTFFFLLSVWMLLAVVKQRLEEEKTGNAVIMHILLGLFLAVLVFLVPSAAILVPVFLLVLGLLLGQEELEQKRNALVSQLLFSVLLLAVWIAGTMGIRIGTGIFIGKELPSFVNQGGYEMLTSLNMDYNGEQNEEDHLIRETILLETGSADEVHRICKNLAYERWKQNIPGSMNLLIQKLNRVFGIGMNENGMAYWLENYYYLIGILFAMLFALQLWQNGPSEKILLFVVVNLMAFVLVWFIGEYEISQMLAPLVSVMAAMEIGAQLQDKKMIYSLIWREEKLRAEEESSWIDEIGRAVREDEKKKGQRTDGQEKVFRGRPEFEPAAAKKAEPQAEAAQEQTTESGQPDSQKTEKTGQYKKYDTGDAFGQAQTDGQEERRRLEELLEKEMLFDFTLLEEEKSGVVSKQEPVEEAKQTAFTESVAADSLEKQSDIVEEKGNQGEIQKLKSHLKSVLEEEDAKEKAARIKELLEIQNEIDSMIQVMESTKKVTLEDTQEDQREKRRRQIERAKEQQSRKTAQNPAGSARRAVRPAYENRQLEKIFGPSFEGRVPVRPARAAADSQEMKKTDGTTGQKRTGQKAVRPEAGMRFSETGREAGRKTTEASAKKRRPRKPVQNSFTKI